MLHALRACRSDLASENEQRLDNHTTKPLTFSHVQMNKGFSE